MSQAKSVVLYGMGAELEGSYGAGGTIVAGEDAVRMTEEVVATVQYANDGGRGFDPATGRPLKRGVASAGTIDVAPGFRAKGAGAAYSATVGPHGSDLIRCCGWDATVVTTPSSESYSFALTPLTDMTPDSCLVDGYARGKLYRGVGMYGSLGFIIDAGGYMVVTTALTGILSDEPTDVAVPAFDYGSVMPPKAVGMALSIGDFDTTPAFRRIEFQQGRTLADRMSGNAADGHAGKAVGSSDPRIIIDLEETALATTPFHAAGGIDHFRLYKNATEIPITFQLGSVQYNQCTFTASECQLVEPPGEPADGPTAMVRLTFQVNDAMTWLFD